MLRLLGAALIASIVAACGGDESDSLSAAELSRAQTLALDLAASLGDRTPAEGVAVAADRREAARLFWPGTAVENGAVIVVVLRGDFSLHSSPPTQGVPQAETLPVLIVFFDRRTMQQLDVGQQQRFPTDSGLAGVGDVVRLPL